MRDAPKDGGNRLFNGSIKRWLLVFSRGWNVFFLINAVFCFGQPLQFWNAKTHHHLEPKNSSWKKQPWKRINNNRRFGLKSKGLNRISALLPTQATSFEKKSTQPDEKFVRNTCSKKWGIWRINQEKQIKILDFSSVYFSWLLKSPFQIQFFFFNFRSSP